MKKSYLASIIIITTMVAIIALAVMLVLVNNVSVVLEPVEQPKPAKVKTPKLVTPSQVEVAVNEFRAKKGLYKLDSNVPALDKAAQVRAEGMCKENDWSHKRDWEVLDKYYAYSHAGENLYYGLRMENQAANAVYSWSKSPSHLKAMTSEFTQMGIGVKYCPGFQGNDTAVIITNYFGVPR